MTKEKKIYQTWTGRGIDPSRITHAIVWPSLHQRTMCGRHMRGYLESDLNRYGVQCRKCTQAMKAWKKRQSGGKVK